MTSIATNSYDDWGMPALTNMGRFGYTGQTWLPEAGLWYYKARMYSPTLGRFMQTDPIGYADGLNWYNYVGSDPVNKTDPTGLMGACPSATCIKVTGPGVQKFGYNPTGSFGPYIPFLGELNYPTFGDSADAYRKNAKAIAAGKGSRKVDTADRTKALNRRVKQLYGEIRACAGPAASGKCKPLWDELARILETPEMRIQRQRVSDDTWDGLGLMVGTYGGAALRGVKAGWGAFFLGGAGLAAKRWWDRANGL